MDIATVAARIMDNAIDELSTALAYWREDTWT